LNRAQRPTLHNQPKDLSAGVMRESFAHAVSLLYSYAPRIIPAALTTLDDKTQVAITFDDGPDPQSTLRVLEVLAELNLKASFFLLGEKAERNPTLTQAIVRDGHSVGIHGFQHRSLFFSTTQFIENQLQISMDILRAASGTTPRFFRPPYGKWNPMMNRVLVRNGLSLVLWSCMPRDYALKQMSGSIVDFFNAQLFGGEILVLHEIAGSNERMENILVQLERALVTKRLRAVTLDEGIETRQQ